MNLLPENLQNMVTTSSFVTDNIHDWLNEVNMGNGLAPLLTHFEKYTLQFRDPTREPLIKERSNSKLFMEMANRRLPNNAKVERDEIKEILLYHHDYYRSSENVENLTFEIDPETQIISTYDRIIQRIIQIHNAYIQDYNSTNRNKLNYVTPEDAINGVAPQMASLTYDYSDGGETGEIVFNVQDVISVPVTVTDPFNGENANIIFNSVIVGSALVHNSLYAMAHANGLFSPQKKRVDYQLFQKYFNNGNENYIQGRDTGLYFRGIDLTYTPNILPSDNLLRDQLTGLGESRVTVDEKIRRIRNHFSNQPMTAFQFINNEEVLENKRRLELPIDFEQNTMRQFIPTSLNWLYRIPRYYLTNESRRLLSPNTTNGKILNLKMKAVTDYFKKMNMVYLDYGL